MLQFKSLLLLALSCFLFCDDAQAQTLEWTRSLGGKSANEGNGIAIDAASNVYTIGTFGGTIDFDPGPGTHNLTASYPLDGFIRKLDASGNLVWAKKIGSSNYVYAKKIAVDTSGNILTVGRFSGTIDLDPGAGTHNLTSNSSRSVFIQKLDASGNFVWGKHFKPASISGLALDSAGNVFMTGNFQGTVDFDPGPGVFSLSSNGGEDIFIQKLDLSGNFVWAKAMGGPSRVGHPETGNGIVVDPAGNIFTTGSFEDTVDFDPGPGISNQISAGKADIFIQKLDASGNFLWVKTIGGPASDEGLGISLHTTGDIYVTGAFGDTVDFDPGPGRVERIGGGYQNPFVIKLNASGNLTWAASMYGTSNFNNSGFDIALDAAGNVYTTGYFLFDFDFDPGPGTNILRSISDSDAFVHKLDASGNFVWVKALATNNHDKGNGIVVDKDDKVYVTGTFDSRLVGLFDPEYESSANVYKLSQCPSPNASFTTSPSALSASFTDASTGGTISNWAWDFGDGNTSTLQNPTHTYSTTGTFTVCLIVTNSCGSIDTTCQTVSITCSIPAALAEQGCTGCGEIQLSAAINGTAPNLDTEIKNNSAYAAPNTLVWYADNNGSQAAALQATPVINTANPGSVSYWVAQSAGAGCTSPARKVVVSVASPAPPAVSVTFCPGQIIDLASKMRDYTLKVTMWEFYDGDPAAGGFLIGRAQAVRGIARAGQKTIVAPLVTTTYHVRTHYRTGGPTVSIMILTASPNCGGPVKPIVALQGGWNAATGQHRTQLQAQNLLPQTEPYTALGYSFSGGGGEVLSLAAQQNANIVDWVIVELRDSANPTQVIYSRAGLLLKDGFIVDTDGVSLISAPVDNTIPYYLAVIHRNHLGVMTAQPVALGTIVDFSNPQTVTYGNASSLHLANGKAYMYAGDADGNGQIQNTDNVMKWMPSAGTSGYQSGDYNLDGQVQNSDLLQLWQPNTGRGSAVPR